MAATQVNSYQHSVTKGFSILELVVVLAVLAVLLTLAVPTYRQYVERAERAEAIRLLLAIAGCQERIRAEHGHYDSTQCLENIASNNYLFQLEPAGNSSTSRYTVQAVPIRDEGKPCGTLGMDHTGTRSISAENGTLFDCWGGR